MVTTTSTTASVVSPAPTAFPIRGIHLPSHLDAKEDIAENWKTFKQAWSNKILYAIIMNIHKQPNTYQVSLFLHCIGPKALKNFLWNALWRWPRKGEVGKHCKEIRRVHHR